MNRLRVIAVEKGELDDAIACVYKDNQFYVYDTFGELYLQKEYFSNFYSLLNLVNTDKFELTDFYIDQGTKIQRGNLTLYNEVLDVGIKKALKQFSDALQNDESYIINGDLILTQEFRMYLSGYRQAKDDFEKYFYNLISKGIYINEQKVNLFNKLKYTETSYSYTIDRLFFKLLMQLYGSGTYHRYELEIDYHNKDMIKEIEEIVELNPTISSLDDFNKELIVRSRLKGVYSIIDRIYEEFDTYCDNPGYKQAFFYDIFTRLFKLEYNNYIDLDRIYIEK
ncbi:hypothetical protein [Haloplasma contractile]|uniref:Uncharacterized protein n=1 Tax=Haloplasma contractile SSD-17B TaxID=1033810 RepID=F7PU40_9MOLU|nr:hypothetical protein [Haloplasma contractile]ERJ11783.1 hypothetical protein HLPCO_002266 [Haloplasma contractile SSD-17B]